MKILTCHRVCAFAKRYFSTFWVENIYRQDGPNFFKEDEPNVEKEKKSFLALAQKLTPAAARKIDTSFIFTTMSSLVSNFLFCPPPTPFVCHMFGEKTTMNTRGSKKNR